MKERPLTDEEIRLGKLDVTADDLIETIRTTTDPEEREISLTKLFLHFRDHGEELGTLQREQIGYLFSQYVLKVNN
jgi:hypothetical protein